MDAATDIFQERREFARRRQAIIAANAELYERELIKLATLASALADALRRRGVSEPAATLAAEAGISLFKISFGRWVDDSGELTLSSIIQQSLDDMRSVTAGRGAVGVGKAEHLLRGLVRRRWFCQHRVEGSRGRSVLPRRPLEVVGGNDERILTFCRMRHVTDSKTG